MTIYEYMIVMFDESAVLVDCRDTFVSRNSGAVICMIVESAEIQEKIRQKISSLSQSLAYTPEYAEREIEKLESIQPISLKAVDLRTDNAIARFMIATTALIFLILLYNLIVSGTILVLPEESRTYRRLAKLCDPEEFMHQLVANQSATTAPPGRDKPSPLAILQNEGFLADRVFVATPHINHLFIAPTSSLLWAFLAFRVTKVGRFSYMQHVLRLSFSTGVTKTVVVFNKQTGVLKLQEIKRRSPNTIVGFNHDLLKLWGDPDRFEQEVRNYSVVWQDTVSDSDHADIIRYLGLGEGFL
jgi:hypothetical protein